MTVHRPPPTVRPSAPQGNQCVISQFLAIDSSLGGQVQPDIAHPCCDQLTAVKTGYPLTSITWPYRGLRCRPIEVEYLFEVIRWQVTSFQMIAGSSLIFLIHMKYVVFMCRTIKILISNWPRTRKIQPAATGREDSCFWLFSPCSRVGHALRPIFMLWLVKIWQVSSSGIFIQHLEICLLIAEVDRVLCHLVMLLTAYFHWM